MPADFTIKQHDQLPELVVTLTDALGDTVDVSSVNGITFVMDDKGTAVNIVSSAATVVNGGAGVVKYSWADGDTDIAGTYNGEFEVVFQDGRAETFPNAKNIVIKVFPDLGGSE